MAKKLMTISRDESKEKGNQRKKDKKGDSTQELRPFCWASAEAIM